ncbi:hypothetical protein L9F63_019099 [Diploptera punctata]|uniref:Cytochrome P450 n=1 Tax=Diploptera punctata TaxID=6984 RepID=A0AAD7ZUZ4_DIPPU|nr:hypothetical protein L9F63_019099 [Diploptera punctata]
MAGEWRKKYGPIVGYVLGSGKFIAICGPHEVLEVLKRDEFQGRPKHILKERSFNKPLGIFFSDGPYWVDQRRFTLRYLRDLGFGKKSMESQIMDEVEEVIKDMAQKIEFQGNGMFDVSTLNVLWRMLAGKRYSRDDNELKDLLMKLKNAFRSGSPVGRIAAILPILKHIKFGHSHSGHSEVVNTLHQLQEFFRKSIHEHKKTIDENNPRDFLDIYINEMNKQSNNPESNFTEEGLITICLDMFSAGGETTSGSLEFSLMYMVLYPQVQEAVHKELDAVVGQNRRPSLDDRPNLHYVEAVLTELLRVCSIAPVTPPHRTTKDTYINGYFIPQDTTLAICLYSLFQDKEHWGDPEVFRPERFLNSEGVYVKDDWMIPFGAGKRVCLGEGLARSTVFLFFTTLLQEFTFTVPEGDPPPSEIPLSGTVIAPQSFNVKVTKRF